GGRISCPKIENWQGRVKKTEKQENPIPHLSHPHRKSRGSSARMVFPLPCQNAREAQKPPQGRVVVLGRPNAAEGDDVRVTSERTKLHLRKRVGDRGLARKAHPHAEGNEMHRGLAAHIKSLHIWTMTEIRKTVDDIVLECRTWIGLAQDAAFVAKSLPFDLLPATESVPSRENYE